MEICCAEDHHISAIQRIYAHHVTYGLATFETEPPDVDEMRARLTKIQSAGLLWLVAIHEGKVRGYCYLGPHRARYAYRFTLEDSIYVDAEFQHRGVGKALLNAAIEWAQAQGYRQLVAVVGNSENVGSLGLHRAAGFRVTGTLEGVGFKHGRWLDTVIMQRQLGEGASRATS
nr:GNAT family N-acetyltransferase [uncultured Enterobacter sp.]